MCHFLHVLGVLLVLFFVLCHRGHVKGNGSYVLFVPYLAHTHISIKIKVIFLKVVFY